MKIIFLDVDGVLNSDAFEERMGGNYLARQMHERIDPAAVGRLNRLTQETRACVVISSTWRKLLDLVEIHRVLVMHGFHGLIVGRTPDFAKRSRAEFEESFKLPGKFERGHEIEAWLKGWPTDGPTDPDNIESYVILDDGDDMAHLLDRHVHVDPAVGLTEADVERAITILEKKL